MTRTLRGAGLVSISMIRRSAVLAVLAVLAPISATAASAEQAGSCPAVIAHRTSMTDAPENTVPGIAKAAQLGAKTVEVDVQWSASNYPVLMHDPTVDRTTNGTGTVAKLGLNYLIGLSAVDGEPWKTNGKYKGTKVPYAWDFLNAAKTNHVDLLLDIKTAPSKAGMDKLIDYVDRFGYRSHLTLMSNVAAVTTMHGWYPDLHYLVIEYPPAGMVRIASTISASGATGYAIPWDRVSATAVDYYRANGLDVFTWTSDRPEYDTTAHWADLASAGVTAIITNDPDGLIANHPGGCT